MIVDSLKLTVYFGESDRVGDTLFSDALFDLFEEQGVLTATLLRAVEGFGIKQQLRTDRFLTLSEDLPLTAVAVDERPVIEALASRVSDLLPGGLITLERVRLLHGELAAAELDATTKLTLYLGRDEPYLEVVDRLQQSGLAGATVVIGVDGMTHRQRRRARFFSRNGAVPLMVISVGAGEGVEHALEELGGLVRDPIATLERVQVCKRDGTLLTEPEDPGLGRWQKLMVYASEEARHQGHPVYVELIRRLRQERASGATALRGTWGFSGDHAPHGDRLFRLRRRVPVITTIVDTPEATRRWFRIVDEVTGETGLVTSEIVPSFEAF